MAFSNIQINDAKFINFMLRNVLHFMYSYGTNLEIRSKIACLTVNVLYYLECNLCKLEVYIGKSVYIYKI